jgi:hypothetical protein
MRPAFSLRPSHYLDFDSFERYLHRSVNVTFIGTSFWSKRLKVLPTLRWRILLLASAAAILAVHNQSLSRAPQARTAIAGPAAIYPDASVTPGATNPNVTEDNIEQTICVQGFTKTIRPQVAITNRIKRQQMKAYHDTVSQSPPLPVVGKRADTSKCVDHSADRRCYELDHLISLELGGCPDCLTNLWPEAYNPKPGAHEKDKVENFLHRQVCSGAMTLDEAQHEIVQDWYKVYEDNHLH